MVERVGGGGGDGKQSITIGRGGGAGFVRSSYDSEAGAISKIEPLNSLGGIWWG